MPGVLRPDPFNAILLTSESLTLSEEQKAHIQNILRLSCSDSRFVQKSYEAIRHVLTAGSVVPPEITSLSPDTAALGSESFDLHVTGKGFNDTDTILWNGSPESTTHVSGTELTTRVNMDTAVVPVVIPVEVKSADGVVSNTMTFTLTETPPLRETERKKEDKKKEEDQRTKEEKRK